MTGVVCTRHAMRRGSRHATVVLSCCVMTDPSAPKRGRNGWREGYDPAQRLLRVAAAIAALIVFVALSVDPDRHVDDLGAIALAAGVLLVLMCYEGVIRVPLIGRRDDDDD